MCASLHFIRPPGSLPAWTVWPNAGQSQSQIPALPFPPRRPTPHNEGGNGALPPFLLVPAGAHPHLESGRGAGQRRALKQGSDFDFLLTGNVPGSRIGEKHHSKCRATLCSSLSENCQHILITGPLHLLQPHLEWFLFPDIR